MSAFDEGGVEAQVVDAEPELADTGVEVVDVELDRLHQCREEV